MAKLATKEMAVTKDMTIGEVISTYPEAARVMTENGLHCIGCGASPWETIEGGTMGHGMSGIQMNKLLEELNKLVKERKSGTATLFVTDLAVAKLKKILKSQKKENYGLAVSVTPGGCSGFMYAMDFQKEPNKGDVVVEKNGVKIFIDSESSPMIRGANLDYVEGLQGSGFKIENPNATSSCGCGKSFS